MIFELRHKATTDGAEPSPFGSERLEVDKQFSLYSGLEEHRPQRIPLTIRLYTGYHTLPEKDGSSSLFVSQVREVFQELFSGHATHEVVRCQDIDSYDHLANFVDLLDDFRLDHTLVFQVDEFWVPTGRSLLDLTQYWNAVTSEVKLKNDKWEARKVEETDPTGGFQPHVPQRKDEAKTGKWQRRDFFRPEFSATTESVDRVPFLWDCGLLLARKDLWIRKADVEIRTQESSEKYQAPYLAVATIWNCLCCKGDRIDRIGGRAADQNYDDPIPWSVFLDACEVVGQGLDVRPFDLDLRTRETLCSLLLEMWLSEAFDGSSTEEKGPAALAFLTRRENRKSVDHPSLRTLVSKYSTHLYDAMRRLFAFCPHLKGDGLLLHCGSADNHAVAARHWYSTAVVAMKHSPHFRPLRLPGVFSTRGDWFLSVAKGSRSELLGHRALDLLTSRRMNLLRLHDGLGLPSRDIIDLNQEQPLRTALGAGATDNPSDGAIGYGDLCDCVFPHPGQRFHWLWRSQIKSYAQHSLYFFRWICRVYLSRLQSFDFSPDAMREKNAEYYQRKNDPLWIKFNEHIQVLLGVLRESEATLEN